MDRGVVLRGGAECHEIPGGWVVRHRDLPRVYNLNLVLVAAPAPKGFKAQDVTALADRWLGDSPHRCVRMEDAAAAERIAPALMEDGWKRQRTALMLLSDDTEPLPPDPRARQITEPELEALMLADFRHTDYGADYVEGLPEMLVAAQTALRVGTPALRFGAGENGELQSMCTLFCDDDVAGSSIAMVEQVATLPAHRERGLAKATVSAAIAAARQRGAQLIMVPADADDWPQLMYARLGFEPVGQLVNFHAPRPGTGRGRSAV